MASRLAHRRVHSGQIVAAQGAVVLAVLTGGHPAGMLAAAAVLAVAFGRWRGRWLHQWCVPAAGFALRRRTTPAEPGTAGLLALAHPGVRVTGLRLDGQPAAALSGGYGDVAVLEVGEQAGGLAGAVHLPGLGDLPVVVQTLVTAYLSPATDDQPATSYQQLTGGGALTTRRLLLAVRVPADGDLDAAVRQVGRRLAPVPVRALTATGLDRALAEVAYAAPARERWSAVRAAGLTQVTYHLGAAADLVPHLLRLPAAATTVAVRGGEVFVRVATGTEKDKLVAERALHRLLTGRAGAVCRLDGEHLPGVAATLPLAVPGSAPSSAVPDSGVRVDPAGVMLGRDPSGAPVLADLFGPAPARAVLIGGRSLASLLAWRALGAGARVTVETARAQAWQPLVRAAEGTPLRVAPTVPTGDGQAARPALHLVDADGAGFPDAPGDWRATVVLRPRVSAADAGLLSQATLVLARALDEQESTLVNATLGLGRAGAGLRVVGPQSLTAISRGVASEVRVSMTTVERLLVGEPAIGAGIQ